MLLLICAVTPKRKRKRPGLAVLDVPDVEHHSEPGTVVPCPDSSREPLIYPAIPL